MPPPELKSLCGSCRGESGLRQRKSEESHHPDGAGNSFRCRQSRSLHGCGRLICTAASSMNEDARLIQQICAGRVRTPEPQPPKERRRLPKWIRLLFVALLAAGMFVSYLLYDLFRSFRDFQREHHDRILLLMRELIQERRSSLLVQADEGLFAALDSMGLRNPGDALIRPIGTYPDGLFGNRRQCFICTVTANSRDGALEVDLRFDSSARKYLVTGFRGWDGQRQGAASR